MAQARLREGWSRSEVQRALFVARQRFGHALCECRPEPLKLQVRLREDRWHLAVWPQEGPAHDSECMFFHDEVAAGASAKVGLASDPAGRARSTHPNAATAPSQRIALWTRPADSSGAGVSPGTIRSIAQSLWEAASLCRWHPSWIRDWSRTRYQLREAATEFSVAGCPLEQLLFVPRPFRRARAAVSNQEWQGFVQSLRAQPQEVPRLLIAPVRCFVAAHERRGAAIFLRHLLAPIELSVACFDCLSRDCRNALANSRLASMRPIRDSQTSSIITARLPELIGFFFVEAGPRGSARARAGWLMAVHPGTYIPASNGDLVILVDALVSGGHVFQHLISEAPPGRRTRPDWLVRQVRGPDGVPVARAALEVMARSVSADYLALRHGLAARMAEQGIPTWVWTPCGSGSERRVPQLPPPERTSAEEAARVVAEIRGCADADYQFGPSGKFGPRQGTHA